MKANRKFAPLWAFGFLTKQAKSAGTVHNTVTQPLALFKLLYEMWTLVAPTGPI